MLVYVMYALRLDDRRPLCIHGCIGCTEAVDRALADLPPLQALTPLLLLVSQTLGGDGIPNTGGQLLD